MNNVLTRADPATLQKPTLIAELNAAGLSSTGSVADLRNRLRQAQALAYPIDPVLEAELLSLHNLHARGLLDDAGYAAAQVAAATRRPASTTAAPPVALEDPTKTGEKQLMTQVQLWAGTYEQPRLSADAFLALQGQAETDVVREKVADLKVATALNRKATTMFLASGAGVTPPDLVGTTETHLIARLAVWQFLTELVIIVATELCVPDASREARTEFRETLRTAMAVSSSATAKTAFTVGVGKVKAAQSTAYKTLAKRGRDESPPSRTTRGGSRGSNGGGSGTITGGGGLKCNFCHNRGHSEKECNKKKHSGAAGRSPSTSGGTNSRGVQPLKTESTPSASA